MARIRPYKIVRSKRKTIALTITPDATLIVRAPMNTSLEYIENLIRRKLKWIQKAIARTQSRPRPVPHEYVEGESFLYLGKTFKLAITERASKALTFQSGFILNRKDKSRARELLIAWYKQEAKKKIAERVKWLSHRSGLEYNSIKITSANKRWGSCSTTGNLNFSWRLIMAPLPVVDYVIVHELAHLEHKNHSKAFWERVRVIYPNYEKAREWLRRSEGTLVI